MTLPTEIKVVLGVVGLGALVFIAVGVIWDTNSLRTPIGAAILAAAVSAGLLFRLRFVRVVTVFVVSVLAVVHLLITLGDLAPWWVRLASGVLTAAYIYAAVLVNTEPARHYLESK